MLLNYFADVAGMVSFHGPMVCKDWGAERGVDAAAWQSAVAQTSAWEVVLGEGSGASGLVEGEAEGTLYGGCLSILVASIGTPYELSTEGTILFLEDVAEKPYRIDRMLMQLKMAGKLNGVKGIVFGEMCDCVQIANQGYTLQEVDSAGGKGFGSARGVRSSFGTRDGAGTSRCRWGCGRRLKVKAGGES